MRYMIIVKATPDTEAASTPVDAEHLNTRRLR